MEKRFSMFLFTFIFVIQGCLVATTKTVITPQLTSLFKGTHQVSAYMEQHRPVSIAVLPFYDRSQAQEGADAVRKGFYNHFSSLPFNDMEIYRVDDLLKKAGLTSTEGIYKTSPNELGKILGVDAVIFGDISNFDKLFAVVYSQVSVGAEIKMYDTKTGEFLWSGKHIVRIHEGGISTTPIGLVATVIATAMNVRDVQLLRACDDLFRDMVATIPKPTLADSLRPPTITLLTQDTKNLPRKAGEEIRVVIQGKPKRQAFFDIGEYKKHVRMEEVEEGGYLGVYKVVPGDNISKAIVTGYLTDDSGNTAQWVDAVGSVTVDTTPPEIPKNLTAVGRNNFVLVSWTRSSDADIAGYHLYRSSSPLSGFQEITKTELTEYRDEGLVNYQKYYYQVSAVDRADNESERTTVTVGMPVTPGPTSVSGDIEADTTWYAGASPYVIENNVVVKDKALLTIEPGVMVQSKGGALIIEGRLNAQGNETHLISFDRANDRDFWNGIRFNSVKEKENRLKFCLIKNAEAGIVCEASSPNIESCEFTENNTAIKIAGAFSKPLISNNTIHKNKKSAVVIEDGAQPILEENMIQDNAESGILIQGAAPQIIHNGVARNQGSGISSRSSQAIIKENNITDNKPFDIAADMKGDPVNALNNWWGSTKGLDVLSKIRGRVDIRSILGASYSEGRTMELPILKSELAGPIQAEVFLILSHSPYRVTKDITVENGAVLYIEPGVEIQFDQKTSIIVGDGGVVAKGTKENPILFTASASSPSPGFYTNAVRLTKQTEANSSFSYCVVKFAATAFDIYYGTPEISYCYIAESAQNGIYCRNDSAPTISYNTFDTNRGEGAITCVGMSNPAIHYNNFIDNAIAIQPFSTIHIDARNNWWGNNPPDRNKILGENINIDPWLEHPEDKAFQDKQ
jgi:parallel beta-helix repeat protein